jgi:predicted O-linked N-acetylglucosamine transferase (SPINDLY family)
MTEEKNAPFDVGSVFAEAFRQHQAGQLSVAERLYQQILQVDARHADSWHMLGVMANQIGQNDVAVQLISTAIGINGGDSFYHCHLGMALYGLGRLHDAGASFGAALRIKPDLSPAHSNLGTVLCDLGQFESAVDSLKTTLCIQPDLAGTYSNLGNALKGLGRLNEAVAAYRTALRILPDFAKAYANLGNALCDLGRFDEAIIASTIALCLEPDRPAPHLNRGNALYGVGRIPEAIASCNVALSVQPALAEAHFSRGTALYETGLLDQAVAAYIAALCIEPGDAKAHSNMGTALCGLGRLDEAVAACSAALHIKPDYKEANSNLLYLRAGQEGFANADYLALAREWEQACIPSEERVLAAKRSKIRRSAPGSRLRIGYVSGDLCNHPVSHFLEPILTHHNRRLFEIFAYPTKSIRDNVTERIERLVDHWVPVVGLSVEEIQKRIESDGIDILIDLSGHTSGNRLHVFGRRAAPVQAHYLGFFASTGLSEMDYWIGDEILTPAELQADFSESLWRLPRLWVSYNGQTELPETSWKPSTDGTIWLGGFNRAEKLTASTIALWAKILSALPEGRLLLKTPNLADPVLQQRILRSFANHGVTADRILLRDRNATPSWASHMAYYDQLDIALDPIGGMGGTTTTCEALWMGVPVVTLEGARVATRAAGTMLHAIGQMDWVARNEEEYVTKVVALARDVELRRSHRYAQRASMAASPLCDARGLASALEEAFTQMIERCS